MVGAVGLGHVEEDEVGEGHWDQVEPQMAFRRFVLCVPIAVGNHCWKGLGVVINVLINHYNYNMKDQLENGNMEIREAIVIAQVRDEGNWNTILLTVIHWCIDVGEIFLEAGINRTSKRINYEGCKGENLIQRDSCDSTLCSQIKAVPFAETEP